MREKVESPRKEIVWKNEPYLVRMGTSYEKGLLFLETKAEEIIYHKLRPNILYLCEGVNNEGDIVYFVVEHTTRLRITPEKKTEEEAILALENLGITTRQLGEITALMGRLLYARYAKSNIYIARLQKEFDEYMQKHNIFERLNGVKEGQ